MDQKSLDKYLEQYGLSPNKIFGQNFLMDEMVFYRMIEAINLNQDDKVVEVGPGIGNLTRILLENSQQVLAIEKDKQFIPVLEDYKKNFSNLDYVLADVLKYDFVKHLSQQPYKVVANIPYYVTGKIIQLFMQAQVKPQAMSLLMQKEVAQNLTAKPGKLNLLALSVQLFADTELIEIVPAGKFFPAPKVDSAAVAIILHKEPKYKVEDLEGLFKLWKACFAGKRKQIHNTLVNNFGLTKTQALEALEKAKILETARPQHLTIEQWLDLQTKIKLSS
ncbi:MAG: 16S rRNA (adenine(1518)-N(6)/adenine(1519)-N(6))-dimethyltransferase RsmA [Candidatus Doudnabacteria bacterium]